VRMNTTWGRRIGLVATAVALAAATAACGGSSNKAANPGGTSGGTTSDDNVSVRLGYFPNLTHGSAIVAVQEGYFSQALKKNGSTLVPQIFSSGSATLTSLLGGSLDATYIGPSPAITAFAQSHGQAVRIISGATLGGASLMVKPDITSISQLKGTTIADPGAGNTQDVALRYFLKKHGFQETASGGGDVKILSQDNGLTLQAFASNQIQGAWVPEPYASELEAEGAKRLVNETSQWPGGKFVTTVLLARTAFIQDHPNEVVDLLQGQTEANTFIQQHSATAEQIVGNWLDGYTQSTIAPKVLDEAWKQLTFTNDPAADTLVANATHAEDVGLLTSPPPIAPIFDLGPLNKLLAADHQPAVQGPSTS
jgi:NitT/TauT family transport system substrate-binding protein